MDTAAWPAGRVGPATDAFIKVSTKTQYDPPKLRCKYKLKNVQIRRYEIADHFLKFKNSFCLGLLAE